MTNQQAIIEKLQELPIPGHIPRSCLKIETNAAGDINISVPMAYKDFFLQLFSIAEKNNLLFYVTGFSHTAISNVLFIKLFQP